MYMKAITKNTKKDSVNGKEKKLNLLKWHKMKILFHKHKTKLFALSFKLHQSSFSSISNFHEK